MGIRFTCGHCGHQLHVKATLAGKRGICPKCQGRIDIPADAHAMAQAPQAAGQASSGEIHMTPTMKSRTTPSPAAGSGNDLPVIQTTGVNQPGSQPSVSQQPTAHKPAIAPITAPLPSPAMPDPIAEAPHLSWYVVHAGSTTQYGPASAAMFRAWVDEGRVSPDSMVWRQDWLEWQRAGDVLPQLAARGTAVGYGSPAVAVGASGSPWAGGPTVAPTASASHYPQRKRMSNNVLIAILVTVLLALIPVVWLVLKP